MTTQTATSLPRYIVQTSSAHMPTSVRAPYRNVAVLELDGSGRVPAMISERARGVVRVVRVVRHYGPQHARGANTAYAWTLAEAQQLADRLNAEHALAEAAATYSQVSALPYYAKARREAADALRAAVQAPALAAAA